MMARFTGILGRLHIMGIRPYLVGTLVLTLILLAGCGGTDTPVPTLTPTPLIPTNTATPVSPTNTVAPPLPTNTLAPPPETQGFLVFPYFTSDAGNFAVQAGEEIHITWEGAPIGASQYEILFVPEEGDPTGIAIISGPDPDAIAGHWFVPESRSGRLEGVARYEDGQEVRSGCCSQVFTSELPPEAVCSLRVSGGTPPDLYQERNVESTRVAGIIPGVYLEMLGRSAGGWYLIQTDQTIEGDRSDSVIVTGWLNAGDGVTFFGPCDDVPIY